MICAPNPSAAETRVALVIGNGTYETLAHLKNPPSDAKLIARTLRGLKFDVAEQVEADERTMKRAIQEFGTSINCRILTTGCLSVSRYVHDAAGETAVSKQF